LMGSEIITDEAVERFIVRWQGREGGQERAFHNIRSASDEKSRFEH
jgi:hypothetical protein